MSFLLETKQSRRPAMVLCDPATADQRLAALTLLDRLVVTVHRAGFGPITIVGAGPLPDLARTKAWQIPFEVKADPPDYDAPVLVAVTAQLLALDDLRRLLAHPGRLVGSDGCPLPTGVFLEYRAGASPDFDGLPQVQTQGASVAIRDKGDLAAAERLFWAALTSSSDGLVDRHFNRPCGRPLSKLLIRTPVTPNQVSVSSTLIGLAAAGLFALGDFASSVWGALLFQVSAIVDCVDGDVARAAFKETPIGKWVDLVGDQVVHAAVFGGVAFGLFRSGSEAPVIWLGASAIAGALIAFGVVLRGLRQGGKEDSPLQRLIDATTNRDFSVLVLLLAAIEQLEWFLWMAAIGSHLFWVTALTLQLGGRSSSRKPA